MSADCSREILLAIFFNVIALPCIYICCPTLYISAQFSAIQSDTVPSIKVESNTHMSTLF